MTWVFKLLFLLGLSVHAHAQAFEEIIGVEVLTVDSSERALESRFGHTLLRLVSSGDDPLNDLVLSFEADVPDNEAPLGKIVHGVVGNYDLNVKAYTLFQVIDYYGHLQKRGLKRTPLRLSEPELADLLVAIEETLSGATKLRPYTFFQHNCANALVALLERAGLTFVGTRRIPTRVAGLMKANLLAPWGSYRVLTLADIRPKLEQGQLTTTAAQALSDQELFILASSTFEIEDQAWEVIEKRLWQKTFSSAALHGLKASPSWFYNADQSVDFDELHSFSHDLENSFFLRREQLRATLVMLQGVHLEEVDKMREIFKHRSIDLMLHP